MKRISRRSFVQATGRAALGAGLAAASPSHPRPARAASPPPDSSPKQTPIRLGLVTYNWGKQWDLPTLLARCEATRFGGVELRTTHRHGVEVTLSAPERKKVARRFADSPVELVGLGTACEYHSPDPAVVKQNIEQSKAFIRLCRDVGGGGIKVRPNGLPRQVPVEQTLEQIGRALRQVAAYAEDYGVEVRLEVHGRGTSELPHIKRIMDLAHHPHLWVCWNCNQQDLEGRGLEENFELVAARIGTVHIHDLRSDSYPWQSLFHLLKTHHFSGWTLLEDGSPPADIVQAMHENRRIWEQLVKEA